MILLFALLLQDAPRDPYLQQVTSTSVVVCWRTAEEVEGVVEYGETEALGTSAKVPAGRRHAVTLRGLKAATQYFFRAAEKTGRFRTAPEGDAAFEFVLYGDGRSNHKVHARVVEQIVRRSPHFVLHSGDLVENGLSEPQWTTFFQTAAPLLRIAPFYPALGNHELGAPAYFDNFVLPGNERWYSFNYGAAHFVVLDSNTRWRADEEQLEWLRKDLAATSKPWKFAVFHHPLYSTSLSESRLKDTEAMARLWEPIFEKGGLTAALAGHNHNYQRAEKNGILYITSGGGGAPLYPVGREHPETKFQKSAYHFVRFAVEARKVEAEVIDVDGNVLERFSLRK